MLLDGAHNSSGARALTRHVLETYGRPLPMVIGMMRDKNLAAIFSDRRAQRGAGTLAIVNRSIGVDQGSEKIDQSFEATHVGHLNGGSALWR